MTRTYASRLHKACGTPLATPARLLAGTVTRPSPRALGRNVPLPSLSRAPGRSSRSSLLTGRWADLSRSLLPSPLARWAKRTGGPRHTGTRKVGPDHRARGGMTPRPSLSGLGPGSHGRTSPPLRTFALSCPSHRIRAAADPGPPPRGPGATFGPAIHSPPRGGRLGPSHSCRRPPSESRHVGPAGRTTEDSPYLALTGGHATRHGLG